MVAALMSTPATAIDLAVARLSGWLDRMRTDRGFGGPVVHWWRHSLLYCGPGLDWRYEGIIAGYLSLFRVTDDESWLEKAIRASDDLVRGQRPDGLYRNSAFELNPSVGGTPHEAAADIGLLLLACELRSRGLCSWQRYLTAAEANLRLGYIGRLWSEADQCFRDHPATPSFVPNKAATLIEALCLLAELTQNDELLERYVRPTADAIVAHQVRQRGSTLDGAIAQNTDGSKRVEKYFPYYNARCVPGLLAAYERLGDGRYADAAVDAMKFVTRWQETDGAFPQVIHADLTVNRFPRWVAGIADVVRAADLLRPLGLNESCDPAMRWLLDGQLVNGSFMSARGFRSQISQRPHRGLPDAHDVMPVVGWNDKVFRLLAARASGRLPDVGEPPTLITPCLWNGRAATLRDDSEELSVSSLSGQTLYRWQRTSDWADVCEGAFI
jgi:hypothetical protein